MQPAYVEVTREKPGPGQGVPRVQRIEVFPVKRGQTMVEAIEDLIRPLCPSRTDQSCSYVFDSQTEGSGQITVNLLGSISREMLDEKVQLMEIERVLQRRQPGKLSDGPLWQSAIRLHVRNPYFQVLFGLIAMFAGTIPFFMPSPNVSFIQDLPILILGAYLFILGFSYWVVRGLRRFRWWHRARAVVRDPGEAMPEDLKVFA